MRALVVTPPGNPFSIEMKEILASNGRIHDEMAAIASSRSL